MPAPSKRVGGSRPWLRRLLLALAGLAALLMAAVAWIAATFDPDAWKPWLVEQVAQRWQRTLTLDGSIRISWFPGIGAEVGGISVSERSGPAEFAGAERLRVSLALLPLLRGQVVVRELSVIRPRATIVTRRDGSRNIDDLLAPAGPADAGVAVEAGAAGGHGARLDIGRITVEKGRFTLRDERTGEAASLSGVDLSTGRLGGNAAEPFAFSGTLQSEARNLDLRLEVRGRLLLDLPGGRHGLSALVATAAGATAGGPLDARLEVGRAFRASRSLDIDAVKLVLRRGDAQRLLALEVGLPSLAAVDGAFRGANLAARLDYRSGPGTVLNVRAALPLQGRLAAEGFGLERVESQSMQADLEGRWGGHTVQGAARGQVASDLASGRHELQRLSFKGTLFGLDAPARDVTLALDGNATAGAAGPGTLAASADGRLNESAVRARVSRGESEAPLRLDLEADQFDLDRYRRAAPAPVAGAAAGAASAASAPAPAAAATPIDFAFLDGLALSGALRIGALRASGVRATNVRIDFRVTDGRLDASPILASLYGGRLEGALGLVHARPPRVSIRQQATGVQVGPLLKDGAALDLVEGRGTVRVELSGQGNTVEALRRSLEGSASVALADGALRGVDILGVLREARTRLAELRGRETRPAAGDRSTGFTELTASFAVREGIARGSDLSMKSPLLRAAGEGMVDLGAGTLDYRLRPTVVGGPGGQGGRELADLRGLTVPLRISGPLSAPEYDFDLQAMLAGTLREQALQRGLEALRGRGAAAGAAPPSGPAQGTKPDARPTPAEVLKGILGR